MDEEKQIRVPDGIKLPDGTKWEGHHIKLEKFEGPLDLLLFLVREKKVNISDVNISEITDQFLEELKRMQEEWISSSPEKLDSIGDFLVMAAVLIQIKIHELLPQSEKIEEEEVGMSKEELIRLLEEYERFKAAAGSLQSMMKERAKIFLRSNSITDPKENEILKVDLTKLLDAFRTVLRKAPKEEVQKMAREPIPIEEMVKLIMSKLEETGSCLFFELFPPFFTRDRLIAAFLALLEIMKSGEVSVYQDNSLGEIRISLITK